MFHAVTATVMMTIQEKSNSGATVKDHACHYRGAGMKKTSSHFDAKIPFSLRREKSGTNSSFKKKKKILLKSQEEKKRKKEPPEIRNKTESVSLFPLPW